MSEVTLESSKDRVELCIICGGPSILVDEFPRERIVRGLQAVTGKHAALQLDVCDYRVLRCSTCGLEFADPMVEPGRDFYIWLIGAEVKYPEYRWEWGVCADIVRERTARGNPPVIVDVGCGDGRFLRMIHQIPGATGVGLDLNPTVVRACRAEGLNVIEGTLSSVRPSLPHGVDIVTLWHVVEHVADPVDVLTQARALLRTGGMICFSVPLTPMSYEHAWPDPLNAPPHHLSRWCVSSLDALAKRVGMSLQLILPDAEPYARRLLRSLVVQAVPPFAGLTRREKARRLLAFLARRPWTLIVESWRQLRLPRIKGKIRPDVVLVCLQH